MMSRRSWKLGRIWGFTINLCPSSLIAFVLLSSLNLWQTTSIFRDLLEGGALVCLVFASILVHELAHSVEARKRGVIISEIELHFFGGSAKMVSHPRTPGDEFAIAIAGPLASLVIGAVAFIIILAIPNLAGLRHFLSFLATANVILGTFNLLPALPMDGGRILRAVLQQRWGALRATQIAVFVARCIAISIALLGVVNGYYFTPALAVYIWILGTRELNIARRRHHVKLQPENATPHETLMRGRLGSANYRTFKSVFWSDTYGENGASEFAPRLQKLMFVRGADGRLWVVSDR